jgi:hypothetical protein
MISSKQPVHLVAAEPCGSCENQRYLRTCRLHLEGRRICERGKALAVPEDDILNSHRCENLKSYSLISVCVGSTVVLRSIAKRGFRLIISTQV